MSKILLPLIFVLVLAVPLFNSDVPELFGFPFFYWYQILMVPVASLLIWIVYHTDSRREGDKP
jgi:hypothetical protein